MPTVMHRDEVQAFAHCTNIFCPGHDQQPVLAIRQELGYTYADNGGSDPFIERSIVSYEFADPAEHACSECGRLRELSEQTRVEYPNQSGHDPRGLLAIKYRDDGQERSDGEYEREQNEQRFAALEAQNAALLAKLEEFVPKEPSGAD